MFYFSIEYNENMKKISFPYSPAWVDAMAIYLQERILKQDTKKFIANSEDIPTIFLAWAPGAWKTEFIEWITAEKGTYIVLDTDTYRCLFDWYTWDNAHEFQQYASWVMDKMYSFCLKRWFNVIIDGTFSGLDYADKNIQQCIKKNRSYAIILVYQDPLISYLYTKKRELEKKRRVPEEKFIQKFFGSIEVLKNIQQKYPQSTLFVAIKTTTRKKFIAEQVLSEEDIDLLIDHKYTEEELALAIRKINNHRPGIIKTLLWKHQPKNN